MQIRMGIDVGWSQLLPSPDVLEVTRGGGLTLTLTTKSEEQQVWVGLGLPWEWD